MICFWFQIWKFTNVCFIKTKKWIDNISCYICHVFCVQFFYFFTGIYLSETNLNSSLKHANSKRLRKKKRQIFTRTVQSDPEDNGNVYCVLYFNVLENYLSPYISFFNTNLLLFFFKQKNTHNNCKSHCVGSYGISLSNVLY